MKIEDNIPIPPIKGHPRTEFTRAVHGMKTGQSILCDSEVQKDVARNVIMSLGGKYVSRKMNDGWRVWRTA